MYINIVGHIAWPYHRRHHHHHHHHHHHKKNPVVSVETKVFFILALDALLTLVPKLVFYVSFTWWFLLASRILTV